MKVIELMTLNKKLIKDFFATISAFIDKTFFETTNDYNEEAHKKYNYKATISLQNNLKALGLDYQKTFGIWNKQIEKSFIVWNTAYSFEQFQDIILDLGKKYYQWAVCIGRKVDNNYEINIWQTDSLLNIDYYIENEFTSINIDNALKQATILTRKIYDKNNNISLDKLKDNIKFESLEKSICCASSESLMGAYERDFLINKLKNYIRKTTEDVDKNIYEIIDNKRNIVNLDSDYIDLRDIIIKLKKFCKDNLMPIGDVDIYKNNLLKIELCLKTKEEHNSFMELLDNFFLSLNKPYKRSLNIIKKYNDNYFDIRYIIELL